MEKTNSREDDKMAEKSITIPQKLFDELAELLRVDETIPMVVARLVDHYKNTTREMSKWIHIMQDDSIEWKQLEQRINKKLSMNDACIIYQWRTTCKNLVESKNSQQKSE